MNQRQSPVSDQYVTYITLVIIKVHVKINYPCNNEKKNIDFKNMQIANDH